MSKVSIALDDVSLHFSGRAGDNSLKTWIAGRFRPAGERPKDYVVKALQNISLRIDEGERVGLIGLNGAGKTTLLKVMAGIYPTTSGTAVTAGHVCPLFEFATGFEMHQTGYDNIRIRGLLLGMTHAEIERKMPEIAAFTELGAFLDYPVKTYSAGMFIRLAFAVSTSVNPEVLLIDEVMGAGDQRFAERARKRMLEFMREGKVLVFSSHSMEMLKSFCSRTVWLERGRIAMDGPTDEVIAAYRGSEGSTAVA
jgi:ABC-type polysaccharide/polyol phosphate transport system ATPase subunit